MSIDGDGVRHLKPDERGIASILHTKFYNGCATVLSPLSTVDTVAWLLIVKRFSCSQTGHVGVGQTIAEEKGQKRKKMNCCSGIHLQETQSFAEILELLGAHKLVYLVENGEQISAQNIPEVFTSTELPSHTNCHPLVVLGDDIGIDGVASTLHDLELMFEKYGVTRCSLGSTSLLASHCIILFHYLLDCNNHNATL